MYRNVTLLLGFVTASAAQEPHAIVAFEAELETTTVRRLADGNVIEQTYRSRYARDSLGRTRLETPSTVVMADPATRTIVFLDLRNRLARRARVVGRPEGRVAPRRDPGGAGEDLGKTIVLGFEAEGRRFVSTIPANAIGNRNAIQLVQEMWYSPELGFTLIRKSSDSINGDTTQRAISVRKLRISHLSTLRCPAITGWLR